jgi:hypothetical protein
LVLQEIIKEHFALLYDGYQTIQGKR